LDVSDLEELGLYLLKGHVGLALYTTLKKLWEVVSKAM
jgi:hypothetical protein